MAPPKKTAQGGTIPADPFQRERDDASARTEEAERDEAVAADAKAAKREGAPRFDLDACPAGFAVFYNPTEIDIGFEVRDEGNRKRKVRCNAKKTTMLPVEYARIVPDRAPQLVELGRKAPEPIA